VIVTHGCFGGVTYEVTGSVITGAGATYLYPNDSGVLVAVPSGAPGRDSNGTACMGALVQRSA